LNRVWFDLQNGPFVELEKMLIGNLDVVWLRFNPGSKWKAVYQHKGKAVYQHKGKSVYQHKGKADH